MFSAFFRSLKQEFAGYNSKKLLADMMAGLTVCAVALPLALAFGVSSGSSSEAGLVTAIIAGVVIAILGGASYQISGPTGAMSAVLVGIVAEYGLQGVFFACFAAGVLLLLAGVFKLGRLISFIPMPVIMGFTSGIAIIIAMGQIDNFFGTVSEGGSNLEKIASYGRLGFHPNMQAVLIGLLVVLVMVFWPKKWGARVPGSLVGSTVSVTTPTGWPARGEVSSPYGLRWNGSDFHPGIDIANDMGTPIVATADGTVTTAGWNAGGYGNMVVIVHVNCVTTRYGHAMQVVVSAGQHVRRGQIIAYMGSTGFSTGPHVHYEVRINGQAVNPVSYL